MPILKRNRSAGSCLLEAIDSGVMRKIIVQDSQLGHFQVDHGTHLFLVPARRSGSEWIAILDPSLLEKLEEMHAQVYAHGQKSLFGELYLWVVCGDECCELKREELTQILDLDNRSEEQKIRIERPPNCSFRVRGTNDELPHTVPLKRFPSLSVAAQTS